MTLKEILTQVQQGTLSPDAAGTMIRQDGYKEMDYAKLDTGRKARTGFAEVIYCSNKADEHLLKIFERLYHEEGEVLGTRASQSQYELVREKFPQVQYDPLSRILKIEKLDKVHEGKIAVCTAGTADIPVAEEAAQTAEYFGTHVERIYDVGVSGMHRLFSRLEVIQEANCVVAVAGMEGALASVMGGLVSRPVIAQTELQPSTSTMDTVPAIWLRRSTVWHWENKETKWEKHYIWNAIPESAGI